MALNVVIPQCESAVNQTIVPSTAYTSSDTAGPWPVDFWSSAAVTVVVTTCSGTLDVYVQQLLSDNSTYGDIAAFPQYSTAVFTTTGTKTLSFVNGGNTLLTETNAALTANTVNTVHFGNYWRVRYVIAGSNATVTFGVFGSFKK